LLSKVFPEFPVKRGKELSLKHEIRTTVYRQEIPLVEAADAGIAATAAADGAEAVDSLEVLLQHGGVVFEVLAVPALVFFFSHAAPSRQRTRSRRGISW
jgi:hypothetical protein